MSVCICVVLKSFSLKWDTHTQIDKTRANEENQLDNTCMAFRKVQSEKIQPNTVNNVKVIKLQETLWGH